MFTIRDRKDLRAAYEYLKIAEELEASEEKKAEIKRGIRKYIREESKKPYTHIVKDSGMDGYIVLMELPDFLKERREAEDFFEEKFVMYTSTSLYGCTGQAFTSGYKVFNRRGRFYAYHYVGFDV